MGHPVLHFEIVGKMGYGIIQREGNTNPDGVGIGGGITTGPEGYHTIGVMHST